MIYVDAITAYPEAAVAAKARRYGGRWCHMWADPGSEAELHEMARTIGLKEQHFQDIEGFPHYDLIESKRLLAIENGAKEVSLRQWIKERRKREKK